MRINSNYINNKLNLSRYYVFPKIFVQRIFFITASTTFLYFYEKKFHLLNNLKTQIMDDIMNSDEVNLAGTDLINNILNDNRTKQTFSGFITNISSDTNFEDSTKNFIKNLLTKVFTDQIFLNETKSRLKEILLNDKVNDETVVLLKFISDSKISEETIQEFFKDIFTSDEVLGGLADLFQESAMEALENKILHEKAGEFLEEVFTQEHLGEILKKKSYQVLAMYTGDKKYYTFDDSVKEANKELIDIINKL